MKHREDKVSADGFGELKEDYVSPYELDQIKIKETFYSKYIKRMFDIIISLFAIVFTLPINAGIAILTYFSLGTPVLFKHQRPGLAEKPFTIFKFRNMTNDTDANGELLPPDERVTKLGKFLRKTSLDELLQFYLILVGKMSLIGPRPLLMAYLPRYSLEQHRRHAVKPGLECPLPEYSSKGTSWEERLDNDIWYVENISFKTDCIMMVRLIRLVFNTNRSKIRAEKIDPGFKGEKIITDINEKLGA